MDIQSIKNRFDIIGNDPQLNYALQIAEQVSGTDLSVLIYGESGVGKEIFSHVIHNLSTRKHNPFIAVNCGAIPEGTIDSELFGHEKGSFTSASDSRKGYFETVNGGTIFLDEIGELPLGTQARLLRVLETGEFIRVGSSKVQKTNVRVIAATNKDLLQLTKVNKFREDLYYRLNTVPIRVPALRERKEDIPLLFRKFASDFSAKYRSQLVRLDEDAKEMIVAYSWPGNVRELKNIAEQISVLATDQIITAKDLAKFLPQSENNNSGLPVLTVGNKYEHQAYERDILFKLIFDLKKDLNDVKNALYRMAGNGEASMPMPMADNIPSFQHSLPSLPTPTSQPQFSQPAITNYNNEFPEITIHNGDINEHEEIEETLALEDMERKYIEKALIKHKGKRKDAASELGISDRTLYRKIKDYNLDY